MAVRIEQPDEEIVELLNDYNLFINSKKSVDLPYTVSGVKKNHPSSLFQSQNLSSTYPFGQTKLNCEVREKSELDYSFSILTDRIKRGILFRLDEGDGAHYNRHLRIPVDKQQVTTPHFHMYDENGILYAYKSERLERSGDSLNIHEGFEVLCEEVHIEGCCADFEIKEDGVFPNFQEKIIDPLAGVHFK